MAAMCQAGVKIRTLDQSTEFGIPSRDHLTRKIIRQLV